MALLLLLGRQGDEIYLESFFHYVLDLKWFNIFLNNGNKLKHVISFATSSCEVSGMWSLISIFWKGKKKADFGIEAE